jgi:hypothetical protein
MIARVETVYVLVEAKSLQKTPLPDQFRAALENGAVGKWTDHAGWSATDGRGHR